MEKIAENIAEEVIDIWEAQFEINKLYPFQIKIDEIFEQISFNIKKFDNELKNRISKRSN